MAVDRGAHRRLVLFPERSAALDIREEKRDGAPRQVLLVRHACPQSCGMIGAMSYLVNRLDG
jgi:hypothetical protein